MGALLTIFAFGTLWFWATIAVVFFIITVLVERESGVLATIWAILLVLGLNYAGKSALFFAVRLHPGHAALAVLVYFAFGIVWSFIKWYFYLRKKVVEYEIRKAAFLKECNATQMTASLAFHFGEVHRYDKIGQVPVAREHKGDILRWSTYWPFSMLGTILNDFVRNLWNHIYEALHNLYQGISNRIFADAAKDAALAKEYEEARKR